MWVVKPHTEFPYCRINTGLEVHWTSPSVYVCAPTCLLVGKRKTEATGGQSSLMILLRFIHVFLFLFSFFVAFQPRSQSCKVLLCGQGEVVHHMVLTSLRVRCITLSNFAPAGADQQSHRGICGGKEGVGPEASAGSGSHSVQGSRCHQWTAEG